MSIERGMSGVLGHTCPPERWARPRSPSEGDEIDDEEEDAAISGDAYAEWSPCS